MANNSVELHLVGTLLLPCHCLPSAVEPLDGNSAITVVQLTKHNYCNPETKHRMIIIAVG